MAPEPLERGGSLTEDHGRLLLRVARASLDAHLGHRPQPEPDELFAGAAPPAPLTEERGVFVTWKLRGALRGCIGYVSGNGPLWRAVRELAVTAATRDSRFAPVTREEWPDLTVSVSAMTAPAPIAPEQVEVGRHGLIVTRGPRRGLLLPQVPIEWGWDRETFLEHTCRKAGLPREAWTWEDTGLQAFEAQVFDERTI